MHITYLGRGQCSLVSEQPLSLESKMILGASLGEPEATGHGWVANLSLLVSPSLPIQVEYEFPLGWDLASLRMAPRGQSE